jgi:hypothetical protein
MLQEGLQEEVVGLSATRLYNCPTPSTVFSNAKSRERCDSGNEQQPALSWFRQAQPTAEGNNKSSEVSRLQRLCLG